MNAASTTSPADADAEKQLKTFSASSTRRTNSSFAPCEGRYANGSRPPTSWCGITTTSFAASCQRRRQETKLFDPQPQVRSARIIACGYG